MDKNKIALLISGFIIIIIGLTFMTSINDTISQTQNTNDANESQISFSGGTYTAVNTPVSSLTAFNNGTVTGVIGTTVNQSRNGTIAISKKVFTTNGPFD